MTTLRRQARSYALQLLYRIEVEPEASAAANPAGEGLARERFWADTRASRKARELANDLVDSVVAHRSDLDAALESVMEQWKLSRLPVMVRLVLRLAACELIVLATQPPPAILNEAMELTRTYMDEESVKFVNSVLDRLLQHQKGQGGEGREDSTALDSKPLPPPPRVAEGT